MAAGAWPRVLRRTASNWAFCDDCVAVRSPWVRPRRLSPRLGLVVTGVLWGPSPPSGEGDGATGVPCWLSRRGGLSGDAVGISCWLSRPGGLGDGALWRGGEESGVYVSGVLDCVSAGGSVGASSSRVWVVRSIARQAAAVYSSRVRGR